VKSKSTGNNIRTGLLRVRYGELKQLRKQIEQLESRNSLGIGSNPGGSGSKTKATAE
jgi:hypothetical protein